jgi:chromosome segregation protein
MLEQAAGITIYKTRKKEAKLKLDATEQDLARIEDLLFEINNQLKSLESQAKKAEKYFEIKKEYKDVTIELAKASLEGFNVTYRDLNQQQQEEENGSHAHDQYRKIGTGAIFQHEAGRRERTPSQKSLPSPFFRPRTVTAAPRPRRRRSRS